MTLLEAKDPHEDCMRAVYLDQQQIVEAIAAWLEARGARARVGDLPLAEFTIERLAADLRAGAWRRP